MTPIVKTAQLRRHLRKAVPWGALLPLAATVLVAYLGAVLWTLRISVSSSRTFPKYDFVALSQYQRLLDDSRWALAVHNLLIYGTLFISGTMLIGFLLAVFIDQKVRLEGVIRTAFLYPYAMSFVATGLVWQWVLNPDGGLQHSMQQLGWTSFQFDWIIDQHKAIYTIVFAGIWQASGLVMALMLAALRGIDEQIWKASRLDGIPAWRVYVSIVIPMISPTLIMVFVLLSTAVVKVFDAVVAMTQGGPGLATDVPAKFIMDYLFARANIGLASAGAMLLLASVLALAAPMLYARQRQSAGRGLA